MIKGLLISTFACFFASAEYSQGKSPWEPFPAEVRNETAGPLSPEGKATAQFAGYMLSIDFPVASLSPFRFSACQPMNVTVTVSSSGNNQGIIEVLAPGDANLKVYLLDVEGGKPPMEVTMSDGKVRNVAMGQYDLILQDTGKKYCNVLRRVTVN